MRKSVNFKTNVQLKSVVGKDLINDDSIAIIELVKNSYDAFSPNADILFQNIKGASSEDELADACIMISDSGKGMTISDIEEKWLNIAYSEKKNAKDKLRQLAGNKGVGRFSCDRLGKELNLYTRQTGNEIVHLFVDWTRFEIDSQDKEIQHIDIELRTISQDELFDSVGIRHFEQGTILHISNLRNPWGTKKLKALRKALERFANPNQKYEVDSFIITLKCPDYNEHDDDIRNSPNFKKGDLINGVIENQIFKGLDFKTSYIESVIDEPGDYITTTMTHRGDRLFTLIEKNPYNQLKDVNLVVYFLGQVQKAHFKRNAEITSKDFGSIFLFVNGFRVSPYGDPGDDWLQIDQRKAQGTKRYLGTRDTLGRIELTGDQWQIISSREGIVKDEAFAQLTNLTDGFFMRALKKLERYVVEGINWDSTGTHQKLFNKIVSDPQWVESDIDLKEGEEAKRLRILNLLTSIITISTKPDEIEAIEFDHQLLEMLKEEGDQRITELLESFENLDINVANTRQINSIHDALKKQRLKLEAEKDRAKKLEEENIKLQSKAKKLEQAAKTYKKKAKIQEEENFFLKASASQDLDDVINMHHHIIISADIIRQEAEYWTKRLISGKEVTPEDLIACFQTVSFENSKVLRYSQFATKKNFKVAAQNVKGDLVRYIEGYISQIKEVSAFSKLNVTFANPDNASLSRGYKPIELTIVIDNLLNNSEKANARNVQIAVEERPKGKIAIIVNDDGDGLPSGIPTKDLFNRGVTTTDGSGLGLHHVREIIKKMKGKIAFEEESSVGTTIVMEI
ncbi:ATP-binding protein [uncultured Pseudodesulfovibrio sp.]|uniref:sensor histidine kinase n=1 Tax=uncultured Pseudodesulfovibrio sp. TaxID=2035858 RepID=UPI0029C841D6|nr:ATP-binding protein [uncultured Pseudodesulfovibrio sp.]